MLCEKEYIFVWVVNDETCFLKGGSQLTPFHNILIAIVSPTEPKRRRQEIKLLVSACVALAHQFRVRIRDDARLPHTLS